MRQLPLGFYILRVDIEYTVHIPTDSYLVKFRPPYAEPGIKYRQPFCNVASVQRYPDGDRPPVVEGPEWRYPGAHAVGLAQGRLNNAWSCQILIPSAPESMAAICPIR